jgi:Xaa-Pro aminopeptidase
MVKKEEDTMDTSIRDWELSLDEKNRRYTAIRQQMEAEELDLLLVWGNSAKWDSKMANIRYLTQIGGNGEEGFCLFAKEGDPILYLWSDIMNDEWLASQNWISDIRNARPSRHGRPAWSASIITGIKELVGDHARVGVVGLGGYDAEGDIPFVVFDKVRKDLTKCQFKNGTSILERSRLTKSPEEIEILQKATHLGDLATEVMYETVRPDVAESKVVGSMVEAIISNGGETPIMFLWGAGQPRRATRLTYAQGRTLAKGDIILTEFSPRYGGYYSHFQRPVFIGSPPDPYEKLREAAIASYEEAIAAIKPGLSQRQLCRIMNEPLKKDGFVLYLAVFFHGMGLGWEVPHGPDPDTFKDEGIILEEGMFLALEPGAATPDLSRGVHVGDPVVVTSNGCRRLANTIVERINI